MITVGDLINDKDYDYISWRVVLPEIIAKDLEKNSVWIGACASKDGKLIFFGNDTDYSKYEEVVSYEEWSKLEDGIVNGLTVIVKW